MSNSDNPYGQSENPFSKEATDQNNPMAPQPSPTAPGVKPTSNLATGSLAQQARGQQLNTARWVLIVVGILSLALNMYFVLNAESLIYDELEKNGINRHQVDQKIIDQAITMTILINGAGAAIGLAFIIMGIAIYTFPVPITILALVLYCGSIAIFAVIEPMTLVKGIIIKIFVIVALFKAVGAAFEYQKASGK